MKNKNKNMLGLVRIFLAIMAIIPVFCWSASFDLDGYANELGERYGFDEDTLRKAKKTGNPSAPEVRVFIDGSGIKEGERVTATAVPMYFRTKSENLYYNWYLIRPGEKGTPFEGFPMLDEDTRVCNFSGLQAVAARIMARGSFDAGLFNLNYDNITPDQEDDDGFLAPIGGVDGVGAKNSSSIGGACRIGSANIANMGGWESDIFADAKKQIVSGPRGTRVYRRFYGDPFAPNYLIDRVGEDMGINPVHSFPAGCDGQVGDGQFGLAEEKCWGTDPTNPDTDGDGISDEADLAGVGQETFTWNYQNGDRVGVIIEGTSLIPVNEGSDDDELKAKAGPLTSYYKIMKVGPGICSDEDREFGFIDGNGCEPDVRYNSPVAFSDTTSCPVQTVGETAPDCRLAAVSERGFSFGKSFAANDFSNKPPVVSVSLEPKNPQISLDGGEFNLNNWITATAHPSDEGVDADYLYYTWNVFKCDQSNMNTCLNNGIRLSADSLEVTGFMEGLGQKELRFRLRKSAIDNLGIKSDNKSYLKVYLIVQSYKGSKMKGAAEAMLPLSKNPIVIDLYKTHFDETTNKWVKDGLVCDQGVSRFLCPVYPDQILYAEARVTEEDINKAPDLFSWFVQGDPAFVFPASSLDDCPFERGVSCSFPLRNPADYAGEKGLFFRVTNTAGGNFNVGVFGVKSDVSDSVNVTTERELLIDRIIPRIFNEQGLGSEAVSYSDYVDASSVNFDGTYFADLGQTVKLGLLGDDDSEQSGLMPYYFNSDNWTPRIDDPYTFISDDLDKTISLRWLFNGQNVDDTIANFQDRNFANQFEEVELNVTDKPGLVSFKMIGDYQTANTVTAVIEKSFSDSYSNAFYKVWKQYPATFSEQVTASVKAKVSPEAETFAEARNFLAATVLNASGYLQIILKLLLTLFLIGALITYFSARLFSYQKVKTEKKDFYE